MSLSEWQEKLLDLMINIETERSAYNGKYIGPVEYKIIRDKIEGKIKKQYSSDTAAKQEYENLEDWYEKEFGEILASRKSKKIKSKSKRIIKKCKCK